MPACRCLHPCTCSTVANCRYRLLPVGTIWRERVNISTLNAQYIKSGIILARTRSEQSLRELVFEGLCPSHYFWSAIKIIVMTYGEVCNTTLWGHASMLASYLRSCLFCIIKDFSYRYLIWWHCLWTEICCSETTNLWSIDLILASSLNSQPTSVNSNCCRLLASCKFMPSRAANFRTPSCVVLSPIRHWREQPPMRNCGYGLTIQ